MYKIQTLLLFIFLLLIARFAAGHKTSIRIIADNLNIDATDLAYQDVKAGDTLFFEAGNRDHLLIKNFQGAPGKPVIMINAGGAVIIDTDNYYGISVQNCRYIKLTGTGDSSQTYGFQIKRVSNGAGMGIGYLSSDFEIDHVSIENTLIAGMYAKTDPDCTPATTREAFTQYNTVIHDNYIANTGNEGMYIGSSQYDGQTVQCGSQVVVLMPSLLNGVKIYNNIVKYSGWDGIQVSSASNNCQIHDNTILFDSQSGTFSQMSGIMIGGGTKCDCYNNFISNGKGDGIECLGLGGTRIFNNIILNAGLSFSPSDKTLMKHGIFVGDNSVQKDSTFYIQFNDIINPKSDGIRFLSIKSKNNLVAGNVIINPGNYTYYQNGNTNLSGNDAYILVQDVETSLIRQNNYLARNADSIHFASSAMQVPDDFMLTSGSPLIDRVDSDRYINFDFAGAHRPFGLKSDIGAFEYRGPLSKVITHIQNNLIRLLQNPTNEYLIFSLPKDATSLIFLDIFDLMGKRIAHFTNQNFPSANPVSQTDISAIKPGIYIYTIHTGKYASSGKFIKI